MRVVLQGAGLRSGVIVQGFQRTSVPDSAALFEIALVADLKTDPVLSGVTVGRVHPRRLPQAAPDGTTSLPALVYEIGRKQHEKNLDGPCGIARCRVLIHCMSRLDSDAKALAEQLRQKYDGLQGLLNGTVAIVETWLDDDPDDYTEPDDGSDRGTFTVPAAFVFRYREQIPVR